MAGKTKSVDEIVAEIREKHTFSNPPHAHEVATVLAYVGKPGENRELKKEVIASIFPLANRQSIMLAMSVESYPEY